ncbi:MAG: hypothetical protein V1836_01370 [Candidatus Aenigmatarchaeota archaeon]
MKSGFFKGQSEVITFVLLGGVIVSLVGAAYMWGAPLTEKRSSMAEAESVQAFFNVLNSKITDMSQTCSGTCTETITLTPKGVFSVFNNERYYLSRPAPGGTEHNEYNNSVTLTTNAARSIYALDRWIGLNTGNVGKVATFGEDDGVIMIRMVKNAAGDHNALYRLWYREIDTLKKGYLVELETGNVQNATAGKMTITYDGRFVVANGAANGKDLEISRIKVDFA